MQPRHCRIGSTAIQVRAIGLGAMPLSIQGRPDEATARRVLSAALDQGTDFIDSANVYCLDEGDLGHNECLIQSVLEERRAVDRVVVATKGGCTRPRGAWGVDGRPVALRRACEQSLKALNRDTITLYQLHAPDSAVPFAESVGALKELKQEGKIQHIGLSNVDPQEVEEALAITRIESVQNRCHPFFKRDLKNGLLELLRRQRITYIPYSPFGGGFLHRELTVHGLFTDLAGCYRCSPYCVILAWLLAKGENVLPIPGASRIESAIDSPRALEVNLAPADAARIDALPDVSRG